MCVCVCVGDCSGVNRSPRPTRIHRARTRTQPADSDAPGTDPVGRLGFTGLGPGRLAGRPHRTVTVRRVGGGGRGPSRLRRVRDSGLRPARVIIRPSRPGPHGEWRASHVPVVAFS